MSTPIHPGDRVQIYRTGPYYNTSGTVMEVRPVDRLGRLDVHIDGTAEGDFLRCHGSDVEIVPPSNRSILAAAQQIERHARHAASTGGEEGKAKASGYRHALHVMHVMGHPSFPSPQAVAASLAPAGTLPGLSMAEST